MIFYDSDYIFTLLVMRTEEQNMKKFYEPPQIEKLLFALRADICDSSDIYGNIDGELGDYDDDTLIPDGDDL